MTDIFMKIVNMSLTASILAAVVLILRPMLKKAPKWISVLLWGLVAIRLICPFSVESELSLMPETDWVLREVYPKEDMTPDIMAHDSITDTTQGEDVTVTFTPNEPDITVEKGINFTQLLPYIWCVGIAVMLLYTLFSYLRVYRRIKPSQHLRDNIYIGENVPTPFVFGTVNPKICLPNDFDKHTVEYVVAHEQAHIRRRDHWWKPLGFFLLTLHWFNPVMWLAYVLLCRDIELACDEKVVRDMDDVQRADYSQALLECSVGHRMISACPLAFGEVGVKTRIKSALNYRKPAFWIIAAAVIACAAAAVCFLTDPAVSDATIYTKYLYVGRQTEVMQNVGKNHDGAVTVRFKSTQGPMQLSVELWYKTDPSDEWTHSDPVNLELNESASFYAPADSQFAVMAEVHEGKNGNVEVEIVNGVSENSDDDTAKAQETVSKIIAGNISESTLDYKTLKQQQEEIWQYRCTAAGDTLDTALAEWGEKIESVACNPGENYVTVFVRDFSDNNVLRFQKALGHLSYILVEIEETIETVPESLAVLTLHDIITLSAKGHDLTWSDFAQYACTDVGSGLYIWRFEIDDTFHLKVGGPRADMTQAPIYIYLCAKNGEKEEYIDIRDGGVEEFIERYQNSIPEQVSVDYVISQAILNHFADDTPDGMIRVESHILLANESVGSAPRIRQVNHMQKAVFYLLVLHQNYSVQNGQLKSTSGSYSPAVLTFSVSENGEYTLDEYWVPRGGEHYRDDIETKFPKGAAEEALNEQINYIEDLEKQNESKAHAYFIGIGSIDK